MGTEQQFCLKWNNHRSTLFSVFDNLLEEESLVDVTLSADGQFIRAHRVILSACSPYFRTLFRSALLNDKHPVVFMKDVDFDNLKSLVEYMYKGEANVPQNMLASFIKTAESLQVRGLAECATKQLESEGIGAADTPPQPPPPPPAATSTPNPRKEKKKQADANAQAAAALAAAAAAGQGGILAARLASGNPLFDFDLLRAAAAQSAAGGMPVPQIPPPMKKPRKSMDPQKQTPQGFPQLPPGFPGVAGMPPLPLTVPIPPPALASMQLTPKKTKKSQNSSSSNAGSATPGAVNPTNNNYDSGDDGVLKIDEDVGDSAGGDKENKVGSPAKNNGNTNDDDDIVDLETSANGVSTEEEDEEEPMAGPDSIPPGPTGMINPWTGEPFNADDPDRSTLDDSGLVGWPNMLRDFGGGGGGGAAAAAARPSTSPPSHLVPPPQNPTAAAGAGVVAEEGGDKSTNRLKRLNRAAQMNAIAMCQTAEGPKFRCKKCNRVFNLRCTVLRHVRHQHEGRFVPHPCSQCGQVFKRTDHLKVHMRKIHNVGTTPKRGGVKKEGLVDEEGTASLEEEEEVELPIEAAAAPPSLTPTPPTVHPPLTTEAAGYSAVSAAVAMAQLARSENNPAQSSAVAVRIPDQI